MLALALLLVASAPSRDGLEARGLSFEGFVTADSSVVGGGPHEGRMASRILLDSGVELDAQRAADASGLTVRLGVQAFGGINGATLLGDVQVFDNMDADPFIGMSELWIRKSFRDGRFVLKVGRMDANSDFASVEEDPIAMRVRSRRQFLHSSMGFSPTMVRFASYPNQALGAVFAASPGPVRLAAGVFDGALTPALLSTLPDAVDAAAFSSVFGVGEVGVGWRPGKKGRGHLTLGGFVLAGDEVRDRVASGAYGVLTQTVFQPRRDGSQGVQGFLQYAYTGSPQTEIVHHAGGGFSWTGALRGREQDALGVGVSWVALRREDAPARAHPRLQSLGHETAVELFYRIAVESFLSVTPDVQAIISPAGRDESALVFTLRLGADL